MFETKIWIPLNILSFAFLLLIQLSNSATFSNVEKGACRGENAEGRGVRLYLAEVGNVTENKDPVQECLVTPFVIEGNSFAKPKRCVKYTLGQVFGEFLVPDVSCNVNRSWILEELSDLLEINFSCDWSQYPSSGCSSSDSLSKGFKDRFHKACVFFDYCYASPWMWTQDFDGKGWCDSRFHDLLIEECQGEVSCRLMARLHKIAVRGFAMSSWNSGQKQLRLGKVKCEKKQKNVL